MYPGKCSDLDLPLVDKCVVYEAFSLISFQILPSAFFVINYLLSSHHAPLHCLND